MGRPQNSRCVRVCVCVCVSASVCHEHMHTDPVPPHPLRRHILGRLYRRLPRFWAGRPINLVEFHRTSFAVCNNSNNNNNNNISEPWHSDRRAHIYIQNVYPTGLIIRVLGVFIMTALDVRICAAVSYYLTWPIENGK